jgi:hypothetical protein
MEILYFLLIIVIIIMILYFANNYKEGMMDYERGLSGYGQGNLGYGKGYCGNLRKQLFDEIRKGYFTQNEVTDINKMLVKIGCPTCPTFPSSESF